MRDIKLNLSGSPGGSDEVLVILEGVHQPIPTTPPDDQIAKMLPAPPPDADGPQGHASAPQTEADKIVQKYDALGKAQQHTYGGYGSNLPNFNAKTDQQQQPAQPQPSQVKQQTPTAPAANPPSVLGSRPGAKPTVPNAPAAQPPQVAPTQQPGPVLPLGAPRRKQATQPPPTAQKPQQ